MKTTLLLLTTACLFLVSCADSSYETESQSNNSIPIADAVDQKNLKSFCSDGIELGLLRVSGANWVNGVGKQTPSILLNANISENLNDFVSVQIPFEEISRKIVSSRKTGNGRQILVLQGNVISKSSDVSSICLRKN